MTRCIIMGSLVSPVSILGPLPLISEHTPINSLALVNIIFVKLMCWWWFHMESIKVGLDLKDLSCSFSRSPLQGLCRSRAQTGIIFMKNLPDSKPYTSQTVAASKAEAKLCLDYYGIGQNPIATCRVRFGSFHLINLRYLTLSSFHDFHLRFIYKYLVQFQQSASF